MRILSILTAVAVVFAAGCGVANAQATPQGQKSDSQIEQAGSSSQSAKKPGKRAGKKSRRSSSSAR